MSGPGLHSRGLGGLVLTAAAADAIVPAAAGPLADTMMMHPDDSDRSTASHVSYASLAFDFAGPSAKVLHHVAPAGPEGVVLLDPTAPDLGLLGPGLAPGGHPHAQAGSSSSALPAARPKGYRKLWALVNAVKKGDRVRGGREEVSVSGCCPDRLEGPFD